MLYLWRFFQASTWTLKHTLNYRISLRAKIHKYVNTINIKLNCYFWDCPSSSFVKQHRIISLVNFRDRRALNVSYVTTRRFLLHDSQSLSYLVSAQVIFDATSKYYLAQTSSSVQWRRLARLWDPPE